MFWGQPENKHFPALPERRLCVDSKPYNQHWPMRPLPLTQASYRVGRAIQCATKER